jgi:uncharacterized small protein (DUF1192 family)
MPRSGFEYNEYNNQPTPEQKAYEIGKAHNEEYCNQLEEANAELQAEIESLKAKLAAQDWHDASGQCNVLPKEEGKYEIFFNRHVEDKIYSKNGCFERILFLQPRVKVLFWRKITLPEA